MIEYEENAEFSGAVEDVINDKKLLELAPIRDNKILVFPLLCIRTNSQEEHVPAKGDPIICRKISPPLSLLTGGHYLVIADYYFWNHADKNQQQANIYHALMHINVEKDDDGLKIGMRKPEVRVFRSEIVRYGAYNDVLSDFGEAMKESGKRFVESMRATR